MIFEQKARPRPQPGGQPRAERLDRVERRLVGQQPAGEACRCLSIGGADVGWNLLDDRDRPAGRGP